MLTLDGAAGEGGGQVLRTALGLSVATGQPFAIENIRARRKNPGLQRQHLTAVLAAAEVGQATVDGAAIGATRLVFRPGSVRAGSWRFPIGTAGSTTLVLQTVLPALWAAPGPSTIELGGGTHNPMAPPFDFLERSFVPLAARMGAPCAVELAATGFWPAGGGVVRARVDRASWRPIALERSAAEPVLDATILRSGIPAHVAEREAAVLQRRLRLPAEAVRIVERPSPGPGNAVLVGIVGPEVTEVVVALGERGVTAEAVAERAAAAARLHLAAGVPVGEHLADQLLVPMALAGGGTFVTTAPTEHTRTNAAVIERFLPVAIAVREDGAAWRVEVRSRQ